MLRSKSAASHTRLSPIAYSALKEIEIHLYCRCCQTYLTWTLIFVKVGSGLPERGANLTEATSLPFPATAPCVTLWRHAKGSLSISGHSIDKDCSDIQCTHTSPVSRIWSRPIMYFFLKQVQVVCVVILLFGSSTIVPRTLYNKCDVTARHLITTVCIRNRVKTPRVQKQI